MATLKVLQKKLRLQLILLLAAKKIRLLVIQLLATRSLLTRLLLRQKLLSNLGYSV